MSWEQLNSIMREAANERDVNLATPPQACPNDGEPLHTAPHGELYCPADGWVWDGRPLSL